MNRRSFISNSLLMTAVTVKSLESFSQTNTLTSANQDQCIPNLDYISAEATGFLVYEHYHRASIPVAALINPPRGGIKIKTTQLDQPSLDKVKVKSFLEKTGLQPNRILNHDHEFIVTQEQLERIASGEKEVKVNVKTPLGNFGHDFYFTATKSALIKVKRARNRGA